MERGEVRWYPFKPPDKRRPVVILSRSSILPWINQVTVAPLTATVRDIPGEVVLDERDGMMKRCAINCDHIQTVPQEKLGEVITKLDSLRLEELRLAVQFSLGLESYE